MKIKAKIYHVDAKRLNDEHQYGWHDTLEENEIIEALKEYARIKFNLTEQNRYIKDFSLEIDI
ncbi:MAG: hypothetical protein AABY22_05560 [Nanoarchaeota archaeon]